MVATPTPEVSVVLAVRDDPGGLELAARSVLAQRGVELELVVVDDGSSAATANAIRALGSSDARVRVFSVPSAGLTAALIRGCAAARGAFVARQDAGDRSEPDRLRRQLDLIQSEPGIAFVSGWTRCLGPEGEELLVVTGSRKDASPVALDPGEEDPDENRGPSAHGSVVFRKDLYEAVGGYRGEFRLAQDWDLWWRLSERGCFAAVPAIVYVRTLGLRSLTFTRGRTQKKLGHLAREAALVRRRGESEELVLRRAADLSAGLERRDGARGAEARALYFIGSMLRQRRDPRARSYFRRAALRDPLLWRAWIRWAQGLP